MSNYDCDFYREFIKNNLSEKRYIHCLNVAKKAKELAEFYGKDEEKAEVAGLLHDVVKEKSFEEHKKILEETFFSFDEFKDVSYKVLHGPAGKEFVKKKFNISDEEILNGIRYHTTGRKDMTLFEKIIFVADYISEERDWNGVEYVRNLAKEDIDKAVLHKLCKAISNCVMRHQCIHIDTFSAYNQLTNEKKEEF